MNIMDKQTLTTSDHFISKEERKQISNSLKGSDVPEQANARLVENVLSIWLDSNKDYQHTILQLQPRVDVSVWMKRRFMHTHTHTLKDTHFFILLHSYE